MKVLITGATGFIGRNLATELTNLGNEVHILIRPTSDMSIFPASILNRFTIHSYISGNLVDIVKDARPDVVYHVAAMVSVNTDYDGIRPLIASNITLGTELLEAMRINHVTRFINTGTFWQHYNNSDYSPVNLYAATKQAFEMIVAYYQETSQMHVIQLHLFDSYGPLDSRPKVLSLLRRIANSGETLPMSPGEQQINLVYIDDIVRAYILAGIYLMENRYELCSTYAVSSDEIVSLKQLVKIYEEQIGKSLHIAWGKRAYRDREVMVPWNVGKRLPGWKAQISLREGISKCIAAEKEEKILYEKD